MWVIYSRNKGVIYVPVNTFGRGLREVIDNKL